MIIIFLIRDYKILYLKLTFIAYQINLKLKRFGPNESTLIEFK